MTSLAQLLQVTETTMVLWFLVFLRAGAAVMVFPGIGERSIPMRVRLAVAAALTVAIAAGMPPLQIGPLSVAGLVLLTTAETVNGLFLGLGLRLFLLAMQTAGSIAAQSTSLAQIGGGAFADPMPAIGQLLNLAAICLLVISGFHVKAVAYISASYNVFPMGVFPSPTVIGEVGSREVARAFQLAFQLAAPFFVLSVLYNIVLGAINRAMPQLMVAFVGAPLITWGSIALLFLSAPVMLSVWLGKVDGFFIQPFGER